LRPV